MKSLLECLTKNVNDDLDNIEVEILESSKPTISVDELKRNYEAVQDLDFKNEDNLNKLHDVAMDAIDVYWASSNWDKKVNDKLYNIYKQGARLQMFDHKNLQAGKLFVKLITQILSLV